MAATSLPGGIGKAAGLFGLKTRFGLARLLAGTLGTDRGRRDRVQPMMHEGPGRGVLFGQGLERRFAPPRPPETPGRQGRQCLNSIGWPVENRNWHEVKD